MTLIKLCPWLAHMWDELWETGAKEGSSWGAGDIWQGMKEEMCCIAGAGLFLKDFKRYVYNSWLDPLGVMRSRAARLCYFTSDPERWNQAVNGFWVVGGWWKSLDILHTICLELIICHAVLRYTTAIWCSGRCGCHTRWNRWKMSPFGVVCSEQCLCMHLCNWSTI